MTIACASCVSGDGNQPRGKRSSWEGCEADLRTDFPAGALTLAIRCSTCRQSGVLETGGDHRAALPTTVVTQRDLAHRDNEYFHCGEPMVVPGSRVETTLRTFPADDQAGPGESLASYLATRVLRCRCGFQMELPQ
jgi:hypothetical protein